MKTIKKIFTSVTLMMTGAISKVFATVNLDSIVPKYGIYKPEPTIGEKISNIGKIALPIILFVIGLFVVLNKKITKKVKAIVVSILIILAILGYVLMNYIATNYKQ